jgi:hypothetical protein
MTTIRDSMIYSDGAGAAIIEGSEDENGDAIPIKRNLRCG